MIIFVLCIISDEDGNEKNGSIFNFHSTVFIAEIKRSIVCNQYKNTVSMYFYTIYTVCLISNEDKNQKNRSRFNFHSICS